jgi:hypothetical protein
MIEPENYPLGCGQIVKQLLSFVIYRETSVDKTKSTHIIPVGLLTQYHYYSLFLGVNYEPTYRINSRTTI